MVRHVFVCGCPRSGTTILTNTLNRHPEISLGIERYIGLVQLGIPITPDLFAAERFFAIRPGDTFYDDFSVFSEYAAILDKFEGASIVGDKVPTYYTRYDNLIERFEDSRIVFIVRNIFDVAVSYKQRAENPDDHLWPAENSALAAIGHWNDSLARTLAAARRGRILVVSFEDLILQRIGFGRLSDFLGVDLTSVADELVAAPAHYAGSQTRRTSLTALESDRIAREADFASYRRLLGIAVPPEPSRRRSSLLGLFGKHRAPPVP